MARVLRNLKIDSVDSVDRGAGRGVKVVLLKRDAAGRPHGPPPDLNKEVDMSSKYVCPECGHVDDKSAFKDAAIGYDDGDDDATEKRHSLDTVRKAAKVSADSIIAEYREKMPGASEAAVMSAATSSEAFMKLFRDEREAAFRSQGHL
jgi:hypothetical protein